MTVPFLVRFISGILLISVSGLVRAEEEVFPNDSGVIDVTKSPYWAKGNGKSDDTAALQQALLEHGNSNTIIFLPNGTYLISAPLLWPSGADQMFQQRNTILQGQSRDGTQIRLADYSPNYSGSSKPRPMIWTGDSEGIRPRNSIRNLTVHTGIGNPRTIGVCFHSNSQGGMRDVDIIAGGDGVGVSGLDLAFTEHNGPAFFSGIRISGFDFGVKSSGTRYGQTFENIQLNHQRIVGFRNGGQVIHLRHLSGTNSVPALENNGAFSYTTLIDSTLTGRPSKRRQEAAVLNRGGLFVRAVTFPGYTNGVENRAGNKLSPESRDIVEFLSHNPFALFPSVTNSLKLPILETPLVPWDPPTAWSGPHLFGGKPGVDCSEAVQRAVNSGAQTLYFPNGTWTIERTITLRGEVRRVIGCEARLVLNQSVGTPAFRIEDGKAETVLFERLDIGGKKGAALFEMISQRTLVIRDCAGVQGGSRPGSGDLFLENVSSLGPWVFERQRVFVRQLHIDFEGTKILNTNATVWVMGLTTEKGGSVVRTVGGGRTEVLGGVCLSTGGWKRDPMFFVDDSEATFHLAEDSFSGQPFQTIVTEVRGGKTLRLYSIPTKGTLPLPERLSGILLPFFTARPQP